MFMNNDKDKKRILVIKLGALGDFIQALGPMKAIRKAHPDDHMTLLTTTPYVSFGKESPYFDDVWIDERPKWFDIKKLYRFRKKLNEAGFSRVYDLQNNDRTSFYLKLFSASNKPEWVGAAKGASHRNDSPERTKGRAFEGHIQTLALAGIKDIDIDPMDWMKSDISALPLKKPYILIVPGCAPSRPGKKWPVRYYKQLTRVLLTRGFQPVIIGSNYERDIAKDIINANPDILDLTGQTSFSDIITLARHAAGAIGNDTGPMHMISVTGCPSTVLFSTNESNPNKHAPLGHDLTILSAKQIEDITVDQVLSKIRLAS